MSHAELDPGSLLELAPGLRTHRDPSGHVLIDAPDGTIIDAGPDGFSILAMFGEPARLGDVIGQLERDLVGATGIGPTMGVINMLVEEGVLFVAGAGGAPVSGWADPVEHARMLHDERRTGDFAAAVMAVVRPGDVVVDIGTGSGVLAVAVARAGARRVYAIEASDIAEVAQRVFDLNGVADRVTLVPGWSHLLELPELADVLVTETIGNEPFEEEILETVLDARQRLLRPGARMIPQAMTLVARPVLLPEAEVRQRAFGRSSIDRWQGLYDIDFRPLLDAAIPGLTHTITAGEVVSTWPVVGPTADLLEVDLATFVEPTASGTAWLTVERPGTVNAIAVTFTAQLSGTTSHTLDPWRWPASSWSTSVWVLPEPIDVPDGAALRVTYHRRVPGVLDGLTCELADPTAG